MAIQSGLAVEEFDRIVSLPENADKRLEFIGGEVVEVVTNNYASMIAVRVAVAIGIYLQQNNLGYVTGADGGYMVSGERYIPDVAFSSKSKQAEPSHATYNPLAPDLAVEVISPFDLPKDITDKVVGYLAAGTVVWVIYPDKQQAKIYQQGQPAKTIDVHGVLDGGAVLPGFSLALKDIFTT
jgi:Uma2 family endonuclease